MSTSKILTTLAFSAALVVGCNRQSDTGEGGSGDTGTSSYDRGSSTSPPAATNEYQRDNTGLNKRDRSDATLTPEDQGGSEADREISRQIRRTITSNDQLSADAKNVKVITINGKVTLRGPVENAEEKQAIETAAQSISGVTSIDNQLEVKVNKNNQ